MNETSTELSIATQINELHKQAGEIALSAKELAEKAVGIAIECGRLLISQKKSLGHGNWLDWVKKNLEFSEETAQRYMRLCRKTDELESAEGQNSNPSYVTDLAKTKAKTLRQAYIATGILPDVPKSDNVAKLKESVTHIKHIDALVLWYRKTTELKSAKDWKPIAREALINDLTPLMEIYNELIELQEASQ